MPIHIHINLFTTFFITSYPIMASEGAWTTVTNKRPTPMSERQNEQAKRRRTMYEPYSLSKGLDRQPCDTPREIENEIEFRFNFWQAGNKALAPDISQLILHAMTNGAVQLPEFIKATGKPIKRVVIIAAHGVSPIDIGRDANRMTFLSECAVAPLRHSKYQPPVGLWRHSDMEPMAALALWMDRPETPLDKALARGVLPLFEDFICGFDALNVNAGGNKENILFSRDCALEMKIREILADESSTTLINGFLDIAAADTYARETAMVELLDLGANSVCGRYKRVEVGDGGFFLVKIIQGLTVLMLFSNLKLSEFLLLITDEQQLAAGFVEFKNVNMSLTLRRAVYVESNRNASARPVVAKDCSDAANVGMTATTETWISTRKERLVSMYTKLLQEDFNGKVESNLLSHELLDCLGFPLRLKSEESGLVFSNIPAKERTLYQTTAAWARKPLDVAAEVEDGECLNTKGSASLASEFSGTSISLIRPDALSYLKRERKFKIIAFDCEMCTTSQGSEVTRISIISPEFPSMIVMDTLVLPSSKITDYNTEFSGITEEIMKDVTTRLTDVIKVLQEIVGPETVFVGHSLDSDLRGLRLIHNKVIDTVALYPNVRGAPFKISLKTLATEVLGLSIQDAGAAGHDSIQDAAVALELALHYLGNTSAVGGYVSPLDIAWSTGDNFAAPRCSLIQHPSLQQLQKELHISTYLCGPYIDRPQFERFLIGYRLEADPSAAFNQIDDSFVKTHIHKFNDSKETISAALHHLDNSTIKDELLWIDLNTTQGRRVMECDVGESDQPSNKKRELDLIDLDEISEDVFKSLIPGTLLIVSTQGDLLPLCIKICKKRRYNWEKDLMEWSNDVDEALLIANSAHAISGAMFLRLK